MADETHRWALDRAFKLAAEKGHADIPCAAIDAFARYISEHEEPPVDPLLIEAREIAASAVTGVASMHSPVSYRSGNHDNEPGIQAILAALRRGMELAGERS